VQKVAWAIPCTYVFEGMREVIGAGTIPWANLAWATGLNIIYLAASMALLQHMFNVARDRGLLGKWGMQ
jgi:ABC-2 type transport system permease protein